MRKIERIVIHCSDSPNGRTLFTGKPSDRNYTTPVMEIDAWHKARGFKRLPNWRSRQNPGLSAIGYHFVIYTHGLVETGRHIDEVGAHVEGYNATSIGICLVGKDQFTIEQWNALKQLIERFQSVCPQAIVIGHGSLNKQKTCPNFDVAAWLKAGRLPLANHLYNPAPGALA